MIHLIKLIKRTALVGVCFMLASLSGSGQSRRTVITPVSRCPSIFVAAFESVDLSGALPTSSVQLANVTCGSPGS